MNSRILWGEAKTDFLVDKRRWRNHNYHFVYRGNGTFLGKHVAKDLPMV